MDKLNRCIEKINRDVVDAERQLRIGQESLDQGTTIDVVDTSEPPPVAPEEPDNTEPEDAVSQTS